MKYARTVKKVKYQTGPKSKSTTADKKRRALAPGKRVSKSGKTYTETRHNRSDIRPKKRY